MGIRISHDRACRDELCCSGACWNQYPDVGENHFDEDQQERTSLLGNFMGFRFAMYRASDAPRFLSVFLRTVSLRMCAVLPIGRVQHTTAAQRVAGSLHAGRCSN